MKNILTFKNIGIIALIIIIPLIVIMIYLSVKKEQEFQYNIVKQPSGGLFTEQPKQKEEMQQNDEQ